MSSFGVPFLAGAAAGYGIAIPFGAIGVLIVDAALRRGFPAGLAAGAGAATADGFYALVAALAGAVVAALIEPVAVELRWATVVVLAAIGIRGLLSLHAARAARRSAGDLPPSLSRTYLTLLGLTIINPMTVVYFGALVLGLPSVGSGLAEKLAFVLGAFLASLSWQSLLAAVGFLLHHRLPERSQVLASLAGNLIVLAFAVNIARGLLHL